VGEVLSLLHFTPGADRPVILNAVNAVDAAHGALQGRGVVEIALKDFDSLLLEVACRRAAGIAGQDAQLPSAAEQVADDGAPLPTCSAGHQHRFVVVGHGFAQVPRKVRARPAPRNGRFEGTGAGVSAAAVELCPGGRRAVVKISATRRQNSSTKKPPVRACRPREYGDGSVLRSTNPGSGA